MRKYFAIIMMACILITGCGSAKAEQTAVEATTEQTAVEATTEQTAVEATTEQPADTATTTATAEQAQPAADETDTVCITFSDTEEVLKCRLDGDTYSCSTSTHTFKMRGVEKIEGQYTFEQLPEEWQMMITKVREHDKW
jgi:hypothetical protein